LHENRPWIVLTFQERMHQHLEYSTKLELVSLILSAMPDFIVSLEDFTCGLKHFMVGNLNLQTFLMIRIVLLKKLNII
jgi:hypothetical protein